MRIWLHLLEKSLMENLIFCAVCPMPILMHIPSYASMFVNPLVPGVH